MEAITVAKQYYEAFRAKSDFSEVPMADGLRFEGPSGAIDGAAAFRAVLGGLAQQVKGLEIRHQSCDGAAVATVYDFDLGHPDGPVPMAELLRVEDGQIQQVELLFDPGRLAPPGA